MPLYKTQNIQSNEWYNISITSQTCANCTICTSLYTFNLTFLPIILS